MMALDHHRLYGLRAFAICGILNGMMTLDNEDFLVASSRTCARIQIVLIIICARNAVNLRDYLFFWSVIFFLRSNILEKMSTKCKSQCNDGRNYKNNTTCFILRTQGSI